MWQPGKVRKQEMSPAQEPPPSPRSEICPVILVQPRYTRERLTSFLPSLFPKVTLPEGLSVQLTQHHFAFKSASLCTVLRCVMHSRV